MYWLHKETLKSFKGKRTKNENIQQNIHKIVLNYDENSEVNQVYRVIDFRVFLSD